MTEAWRWHHRNSRVLTLIQYSGKHPTTYVASDEFSGFQLPRMTFTYKTTPLKIQCVGSECLQLRVSNWVFPMGLSQTEEPLIQMFIVWIIASHTQDAQDVGWRAMPRFSTGVFKLWAFTSPFKSTIGHIKDFSGKWLISLSWCLTYVNPALLFSIVIVTTSWLLFPNPVLIHFKSPAQTWDMFIPWTQRCSPGPPPPSLAAALVAEAVALGVQDDAPHAAERLSGQELHLGVRVVGLHQAGGVDLAPEPWESHGESHGENHVKITGKWWNLEKSRENIGNPDEDWRNMDFWSWFENYKSRRYMGVRVISWKKSNMINIPSIRSVNV